MTLTDAAILVVAGFAGGTINAIAGGATFFTFPAMLLTGIPPVAANASNTVALVPASIAAAWSLRAELATVRRHLLRLGLIGAIGGVLGAILLLTTSNRTFMTLVPFLLLLATVLFAASPRLLAMSRARRPEGTGLRLTPGTLAVISFCAVYGGYFGAGVGIIMLAGLTLAGLDDVRAGNALKNALVAIINGVSVVVFVSQDAVVWPASLTMLVGALAGGITGARLSRHLPVRVFRAVVITVGTLLTIWYFWKL